MDCIFCKIISGEYDSSKIYEDESLLAIMDIFPVNSGHILIIPKKHIELVSELDDETSGKIFILAKKINRALRKSGIKLEGINYFLADGEAAGQEIFHSHLHLIPRFKNDGFGLKFPKGYRVNVPTIDELNIIAEKIKSAL
jgi:histidine triad (HIT) family protein